MSLIRKNNNKRWNNVNPHGAETVAAYKAAVPAEVFARYERGEAAHKNMMENAALYVGAVVIGNMAGLSAGKSDRSIAFSTHLFFFSVVRFFCLSRELSLGHDVHLTCQLECRRSGWVLCNAVSA